MAREVRDACVNIGFFYLAGHGIPPAQMNALLDQGRRFFERPAEEKMSTHQSKTGGKHGYVTTGGVNATTDAGADLRERFRVTRDDSADLPWPGAVPGFEKTMKDYMAAMVRLSQDMARVFALSLGLPERHFDDMFRELDGILYLNYYPPLDASETNRWSFSPHSDYGAFTLLVQDSLGGLQARNAAGDWIDIPPIDGTFVVNLGDLFAMWTNDVYVSTLHRAFNASGQARISVPFFVSPHPATRITCLPTCTGPGNPPRHEPVLSGEYLRSLIAHQNRTGRPGISTNTAERLERKP